MEGKNVVFAHILSTHEFYFCSFNAHFFRTEINLQQKQFHRSSDNKNNRLKKAQDLLEKNKVEMFSVGVGNSYKFGELKV